MESWPISGERLRAMYAGSQANATARRLARLWAAIFSLGLAPRRWVTLEVTGRRSGRATRFPLGMARLNGRWYLVSMLGERVTGSATSAPPTGTSRSGTAAPLDAGWWNSPSVTAHRS